MERGRAGPAASTGDSPQATPALGISALAVVLFIVALVLEQTGNEVEWLWPVAGVLGAVGAIMGWAAGRPRPRGRPLAAAVAGGLIFAVVLAWLIVALITGNLD